MSVFHYTRTENAFSIINSGVIHATHWKYLNDGSEMEAVKPLLHRIFAQEFEQEGDALIANGEMSPRLIEEHGRSVYSSEAMNLIEITYRVTNELMPVFIASFCRHDEGSREASDGLLSQWRGYGSDGGCVLEFDEADLRSMIEKEAKKYACMHVSLEDVEYFNHERALKDIDIEGLAKAVLRGLKPNKSKENSAAIDAGMIRLQTAIGKIAPRLKHPAFAEEREIRIVLPCMSPEAAKEYPKRKLKPVHLRFRSGLPIPYVEVFDGKRPLPITRVIVGPQRRQSDVAYTIAKALKTRKIEAKVELSTIPLVQ